MRSKRKNIWPALTLFFLAPMFAELLSGSAPPVEFFKPFSLLILTALYGSGAVLIRELRVCWGKGWLTTFVLGAAYGIVEEGLMIKSFFDPNWMDLGPLGSYGRWAGINWVWSLQLTIFHAVFSIAIPILLVELLFPSRRDNPWIGRRGMFGLSFLLLADVLFGFFALTTYRPPLMTYLLTIVAVIVLFLIARRMPVRWAKPRPGRVPRPLWFALLGFCATLVFFVIQWLPPEIGVPVSFTLLAAVALVVIVAWTAQWMSRGGAWTDKHLLALAGGALGLFVFMAPLQELDNLKRPDDTTGMTLVGLAVLLFLVWLWRRVLRREQPPITQ
jgi:hypothetical protein